MFKKDVPIIDKALLLKGHTGRCWLCGGRFGLAFHHIMRRSKLRLDVQENLFKLCWSCHSMLHSSPKQFKKLYGKDMQKRLMDWRRIMDKYRDGEFDKEEE